MRLTDLVQKINSSARDVKARIWHSPDLPKGVFVSLLVVLVGSGAFLFGKIFIMEQDRKAELRILQTDSLGGEEGGNLAVGTASFSTSGSIHGMYVGSRNGTAYYFPWCGGVRLIHEENKIWFASKEEATAKGYKPAGNCKGI